MGAGFATVKAPPQTLDTLDDWGGLDALPWSLDAGVWAGAGIYALQGAEASASSSGAFSGASRVRTASLSCAAAGAGSLEGNALFFFFGSGAAVSSEEELGGITVSLPLDGAAAQSGGGFSPVRLRPGGGENGAASGQEGALLRVRQTGLSGLHAAGGEEQKPVRVRVIAPAAGAALSLEHIRPGYKGWDWTAQPSAPESAWREVVQWP